MFTESVKTAILKYTLDTAVKLVRKRLRISRINNNNNNNKE